MRILLLLFLLALVIGGLIAIREFWANQKPGRILYVGSKMRNAGPTVVSTLKKYLQNNSESYIVVDLGAGLGLAINYLAAAMPWQGAEAIEISWLYVLVGRFLTMLRGLGGKVVWRCQDIFSYESSEQRVLYCYISRDMLKRLYDEGKMQGALVLSLTFPIPDCPEAEQIAVPGWQKVLYVYDFRA